LVDCSGCGEYLEDVEDVTLENPDRDWVKVVCGSCRQVTDVSLIRLAESEV